MAEKDRIDSLTWNRPIVDASGRPSREFMVKWQQLSRAALSIPSLENAAAVSHVLDYLTDTPGSILRRGAAEWEGYPSASDATKFLSGANPPAWASITDADLALFDVLTNNVSTTKHGFAPKLPNDATKYLDGTGNYTVPAGGGGGGSDWNLIAQWKHSVSGNLSALEADITGLTDVLVIFDNVPVSSSGWRCAQLSADGGSSWFATGAYDTIANNGVISSDYALFAHSTSSTSARGGTLLIQGISTTGARVSCISPARGLPQVLNAADAPVNRIRAANISAGAIAGVMNGGRVDILGR